MGTVIDNTAQLLTGSRMFAGVADDAIQDVASRLNERRYRKRQLIFSQGEQADSLFVIKEGLVKVYVTSEEGDEMVLVSLGPGEIFGELALIDGGERSASAEAVEPTVLLSLSRSHFLELRRTHPSISDAVDRSLGAVLRRLTEQTADLVFLDLHGRVAKLLLTLAERNGSGDEPGTELDLSLTQQDLAAMVGGSRQSVNQILQAFSRRGYVQMDGRRVVILQPELLRRRAGL